MANGFTYGILEKDWTVKDYLLKFVNIGEKRAFLTEVDDELVRLKAKYDEDIRKARAEYQDYLVKSSEPEFREEELERKKANFPKRIREWAEYKAKTEDDLAKYLSMSEQVIALGLVENKGLRDNMLQQIRDSIRHDCRFSERPKVDDDYDIDEFISWWLNHLRGVMSNTIKRYNRERAELLRKKYQAIELLKVYARL